jgi:hypothetical protein
MHGRPILTDFNDRCLAALLSSDAGWPSGTCRNGCVRPRYPGRAVRSSRKWWVTIPARSVMTATRRWPGGRRCRLCRGLLRLGLAHRLGRARLPVRPADTDRAEGGVLLEHDLALPGQLEAGDKGAGPARAAPQPVLEHRVSSRPVRQELVQRTGSRVTVHAPQDALACVRDGVASLSP